MVVFLVLSGMSRGICSPGHSAYECISLMRHVHCSCDAWSCTDLSIGIESTRFKGALGKDALYPNSLKTLVVHVKLRRESKIMTLSNNEECNSDYNECTERCLHFLGMLPCIEKFLRIN